MISGVRLKCTVSVCPSAAGLTSEVREFGSPLRCELEAVRCPDADAPAPLPSLARCEARAAQNSCSGRMPGTTSSRYSFSRSLKEAEVVHDVLDTEATAAGLVVIDVHPPGRSTCWILAAPAAVSWAIRLGWSARHCKPQRMRHRALLEKHLTCPEQSRRPSAGHWALQGVGSMMPTALPAIA